MIEEDVKSRGIDVVKLEENVVTKHSRFKSFKLTVKRGDDDKVNDNSFWPDGVLIRRWYNPRNSRTSTALDPLAASAVTPAQP